MALCKRGGVSWGLQAEGGLRQVAPSLLLGQAPCCQDGRDQPSLQTWSQQTSFNNWKYERAHQSVLQQRGRCAHQLEQGAQEQVLL